MAVPKTAEPDDLLSRLRVREIAVFCLIALIAVLRRFWLGGVAAVLAGVATLVSWEALLVARY